MFQKSFHTEVRQGRTEKYRSQFPFAYQFLVEIRTCSIQKFNFFQKLLFLFRIHHFICTAVIQRDLLDNTFLRSLLGIRESKDLLCITVIDTSKLLTGTNGPVYRAGCDSQFLLDLIQKVKGIIGIPVHFVDKGKDRDMTHHADLEQLTCLCLYTLGTIDHHNCRIRSHQGTVGILGEILMSRCIQNVNAVSIVMELKYR